MNSNHPGRGAKRYLFGGCLATLLLVCCSEQVSLPLGYQPLNITDGVEESGHLAVGELLFNVGGGPTRDKACTATLVGAQTVISAAHCVGYGDTIFVTEGIAYKETSSQRHPGWTADTPQVNDIGLVLLNKAPPIDPMPLYTAAPQAGATITIIGYGETAKGAEDNNVKRIATNTIASVDTQHFTVSGTGNGTGNGCYGDSGGPALLDSGGVESVAGIMSYITGDCGSTMLVTRIDSFMPWILEVSQGDLKVIDTEKPKVTITAPKSGDTVGTIVKVQAEVTDNVGIVEVRGLVDDQEQGILDAPPFGFTLTLNGAEHWLRVVGRDAAGNEGNAAVLVTVNGSLPPPADSGSSSAGSDAILTSRRIMAEGCRIGSRGPDGSLLLILLFLPLVLIRRRRARQVIRGSQPANPR